MKLSKAKKIYFNSALIILFTLIGSGKTLLKWSEILIKPGKYSTGETNNYDNPTREFITQGFFIDIHPVTNRAYLDFLKKSGYKIKGRFNSISAEKNPDLPATGLTYHDCESFAVFYGRRLPSEWEWEIAARSLKSSNLYFHGKASKKNEGNFLNSKIYKKVEVMLYKPNEIGIYGMEGNVFEWTSGNYEDSFLTVKKSGQPRLKVLRGGSWTNQSFDVKTTTRTPFPPERYLEWIGFRTVKDVRGKK